MNEKQTFTLTLFFIISVSITVSALLLKLGINDKKTK
jgi:hypothetical protein